MQCPKCGTEITREDIIAEDAVQCPGCGAVYRRRSSSKDAPQHAIEQTAQHRERPKPSSGEMEQNSYRSQAEVRRNSVAVLLKTCAWIIYIAAFFLGFYAEYGTSTTIFRYIKVFSTISMMSIFITGFIYGTILLSIGEIIQLLHEINMK